MELEHIGILTEGKGEVRIHCTMYTIMHETAEPTVCKQ